MQDVPRRADNFLQKIPVAFVRRNQVAATRRRNLSCESKRTSNMVVHRNPAGCRGTGAAAFSAILYLDPA